MGKGPRSGKLDQRPKTPNRFGLSGLQLTGRHLAAALIALQLEAQLLAFVQATEAGALDRRNVHEHVRAAVIRLDETETLGSIEPFDCTSRHIISLSGD